MTRTAVVGGKRRLRLGFVFPTEKGSTPSVLAVVVLCLRLLAFVMHRLTATSRLPDLAKAMCFFFYVSRHFFFHQTYAGARKKNKMPKEKKNTGRSVSQTT